MRPTGIKRHRIRRTLRRQDFRYVFGVSVGRTGTSSLHQALQILGFPIFHGVTNQTRGVCRYMFENDDNVIRCFRMTHYRGWVCWPVHAFETFLHYYPDALWIQTLRNTEDWVRSRRIGLDSVHPRQKAHLSPRTFSIYLQNIRLYGTQLPNDDALRQGYEKINRRVAMFLRGRGAQLLRYNLIDGDGWKPLCDFVGRPVPAEPFPHVNTRQVVPTNTHSQADVEVLQ